MGEIADDYDYFIDRMLDFDDDEDSGPPPPSCRYCGSTEVYWVKSWTKDGGERNVLMGYDGFAHNCRPKPSADDFDDLT